MNKNRNLSKSLLCKLNVVGLVAVTLTASCSEPAAQLAPTAEQMYGQRIGSALRIAGEIGVKERHMMSLGYVGGYFGLTDGQKNQLWLGESGRSASIPMDTRRLQDVSQQSFKSQMDLLAKDIRDRAERLQPTSDFDWLALIAQAVVGDLEEDPNIQALQIRLVLLELIEANNNGFSASLGDTEVYTLPPAADSERIDLRQLDPGQLRLINSFKFQGDGLADLAVSGNAKARSGEQRNSSQLPKLILRLCPSSTLRCFEFLRKTSTMPAHFLSYKTLNGNRETVQFHDPKNTLNWHDTTLPDTVTVMIAGVTGATRSSHRTDLFDWEDYVSLRSFIRRTAGRITQEMNSQSPEQIQKEFLRNHVIETLGMIDEASDRPNFPLSPTWDSVLFRELLSSDLMPKEQSQVEVEQPLTGQVIQGTVIEGVVYPDSESGRIQIYQDKTEPGADGNAWELVLMRDVDPKLRRFDFIHEIRRTGINGNKMRALKFVNRRGDGSLLGSRIVKVKVEGLPLP